MSYYHTCTNCGASLDPGERCSCTVSLRPVQYMTRDECLEEISGTAEGIESLFTLQNALRFLRILQRKELIR